MHGRFAITRVVFGKNANIYESLEYKEQLTCITYSNFDRDFCQQHLFRQVSAPTQGTPGGQSMLVLLGSRTYHMAS